MTFAVVNGAIGGALIGGAEAAIYGAPPGEILESIFIGAVTGAATGFIGHSGFVPGVLQPVAHGAVQGAASEIRGGDFKSGFIGGFSSKLLGMAMGDNGLDTLQGRVARVAVAGAVGGTAAELSGGSFANGAMSAAFVQMFNDVALVLKNGSMEIQKDTDVTLDHFKSRLFQSALMRIRLMTLQDGVEYAFALYRKTDGTLALADYNGTPYVQGTDIGNPIGFPEYPIPENTIAIAHTHPRGTLFPGRDDYNWANKFSVSHWYIVAQDKLLEYKQGGYYWRAVPLNSMPKPED